MFALGRQHLAGGDRGADGLPQCGVAGDVIRVEWLLDPLQIELGELRADAPRARCIPGLVRIDHQRDAVPERPSHGGHASEVVMWVAADLELDPADTARDRALGVRHELL